MTDENKPAPEVIVPEKKWYELIDIKLIVRAVYKGIRPIIAKQVKNSASQWDDQALMAADLLMATFFGIDE